MNSRRASWILIGAIVGLLAFAAPAQGQDGYEGSGTLTCTPTSVAPGGQVSCTITGCNTGSTATFRLGGAQVATAVAASPATASFIVPAGTPPGTVVVSASCDGLATALTTNLTVTASGVATGTSSGGSLPATGSNSIGWAQAALILIAVGGLLVLATNKQRSAKRDSSRVTTSA
jgi:large repetitive protein